VAERFDSAARVGATEVADALVVASDLARRAVVRPVEGTILTVARAAGEGATVARQAGGDLLAVVEGARKSAARALEETPTMLEALARAGVVDAGGCGYLLLLDALLTVLDGRPMPDPPHEPEGATTTGRARPVERARPGSEAGGERSAPVGPRYEVMYLLEAADDTISDFKEVWAGLGDSIVVVGGDGLWNCHIHTDDIGAAIEACMDAGRPRGIRVAGPPPRTGVVAVVSGEGVGRILRSLGVHHQVPGGQSMNPSTAQILAEVEALGSDQVIILPNNPNICPVAEQVDDLTDKSVRVVPTGSIVEGFAALLAYDPAAGVEANEAAMRASAARVVPAEVTRAVRDAPTAAGDVHEGDWIGLSREGVVAVADSAAGATVDLLHRLLEPEHELVTLIEGEGATPADTRHITAWLGNEHPDVAVEVHHGGQPLYPYLLGIE